jgi:hypothetical protein
VGVPLPEDLLRAYRETLYRVMGESPFTLLLNQRSTELHDLYHTNRVDSSAFVTACNPRSVQRSAQDNRARMALLEQRSKAAGYRILPGVGQPAEGSDWPAEASILVLGISLGAACALGHLFEQNALVWAGADAIPRLQVLV